MAYPSSLRQLVRSGIEHTNDQTGCLIIGEVAQAHDGSLGLAHKYIDAIADAGADAVKFQTHIASAESTPAEPWRVQFSPQDQTRYDYWKRMEFSEDQWHGLKRHADDRRLAFLSSPFSHSAVELLDRVGVAAWKIASGEVGNDALLEDVRRSRRPVLLSSGMSGLAEIDAAVARLAGDGLPVAVLQCTTAYPCPPERVGLNMLAQFRARYGSNCYVGLSDHSGTIYPGLAAASLGCDVLEVHVTMSREMFGPDVAASVTTSELRQLVEGIRFIEKMNANPQDKEAASVEAAPLRQLFTRSVVARSAIQRGEILTPAHLIAKKPGTGIPASMLPALIGRRAARDLVEDQLLDFSDLEPL